MQAPDTNELQNITESEDDFSKAVRYKISRSKTVEKKTYTITLANIDYIEKIAKEIAKSRDSYNSSASEALRKIINVNARIYNYYDARQPEELFILVRNIINNDGNRPEFDKWISTYVDLVLIPVMPNSEAVNLPLEKMDILKEKWAKNMSYILN